MDFSLADLCGSLSLLAELVTELLLSLTNSNVTVTEVLHWA